MSLRREVLYRVTIGNPLKITDDYFSPFNNESDKLIALDDYYDRNSPNAYVFTEHQVVINVRMSSQKRDLNECTIQLYNIDEELIKYFTANKQNNLVVIVEIGDNVQGLKEVFRGTASKMYVEPNGENTILNITVTDGGVSVRNAYTSRSYPRGTSWANIVKDLNNDLKLPVCTIPKIDQVTDAPISFVGNTYNILTTKLPTLGYNFSIQKGEVNILPLNSRTKTEVSYISQDSGLIGRVSEYIDDSKSAVGTSNPTNEGIKFSCLIDGSLTPDKTVYVKDREYDGAYKIVDLQISFDYEGNPHLCNIVALKTEGVIDG